MLKLFESDNENVNTDADGYVHAFKAHAVAWKCTEHTKYKILGCGIYNASYNVGGVTTMDL